MGRAIRRTNPAVKAAQAEQVAADLVAGMTQKEALMRVGFAPSTARHTPLANVSIGRDIMRALEDMRHDRGARILDTLEEVCLTARHVLDKVEAGDYTSADISLLRTATQAGQDLADRLGAGKVNKTAHFSLRAGVDTSDILSVRSRIKELEDRLHKDYSKQAKQEDGGKAGETEETPINNRITTESSKSQDINESPDEQATADEARREALAQVMDAVSGL